VSVSVKEERKEIKNQTKKRKEETKKCSPN
jgi:hypothetical protein